MANSKGSDMSGASGEKSASLATPQFDFLIKGARGEVASVWGEGDVINQLLMANQTGQWDLVHLWGPQKHSEVIRTRNLTIERYSSIIFSI